MELELTDESEVAGDDKALLVVTGHYRLFDKPIRTLEGLSVFLIDAAQPAFDALRTHRRANVRTGSRRDMQAMAVAMQAQGFTVKVEALPHEA